MARVAVVPRAGCDLLGADKGAYVNVLTLATNEGECRFKVTAAMNHYCLEVVEVDDVLPFSCLPGATAELVSIAQELSASGNVEHVRFQTLHTFPRLM